MNKIPHSFPYPLPYPLPEPYGWWEYHEDSYAAAYPEGKKGWKYAMWTYQGKFESIDTNQDESLWRVKAHGGKIRSNIAAYFPTLDEALQYISTCMMLGVYNET